MNKVEHAIKECEDHLNMTNSFGTEIEAYLTRYLLLLISASFEESLETAFIQRAEKTNDAYVIEYFKNEMPQKLKSVGIAKISEFTRKFGVPLKAKFDNEIINGMAREVTAYSNLIKNRHLVAHETQEPSMTFHDVVSAYIESNKIINKIQEILNQI